MLSSTTTSGTNLCFMTDKKVEPKEVHELNKKGKMLIEMINDFRKNNKEIKPLFSIKCLISSLEGSSWIRRSLESWKN